MRRLLLPALGLLLALAACQTVVSSGPSPLAHTIEGLRPVDGGQVALVFGDGGFVTIPEDRFAPPYCDARLNPRPVLTPAARDAGLSGEAQVKCVVRADGRVEGCGLLQSVSPLVDEVLVTAVGTWRCRPAYVGNVPVPAAHVVFFDFGPAAGATLDGGVP